MTAIADEVGMHKSAMLRYFETREDIFLRLTTTAWHDWSAEARDRLKETAPCPDNASKEWDETAHSIAPRAFPVTGGATAVLRPAGTHPAKPGTQRLHRHRPDVQEGRDHRGRADRRHAVRDHAAGGRQARAVVTTTTSMAGVLWQMAAPGTQLRAFYESEPELSRSVVDVERPPDRHPDRAAHRLRHRLEPAHRELRNPRATPWPSDRRRCHGFNYPSVVDRAAPSRW